MCFFICFPWIPRTQKIICEELNECHLRENKNYWLTARFCSRPQPHPAACTWQRLKSEARGGLRRNLCGAQRVWCEYRSSTGWSTGGVCDVFDNVVHICFSTVGTKFRGLWGLGVFLGRGEREDLGSVLTMTFWGKAPPPPSLTTPPHTPLLVYQFLPELQFVVSHQEPVL